MTAGMPVGCCDWLSAMPARVSGHHGPHGPLFPEIQPLKKGTAYDGYRQPCPRRRPRYAWLAVGPVAAAGAIAIFIATQPAVAATIPSGLGSVGSLSGLGSVGSSAGLGSVGDLSGLGAAGDLPGLDGTGLTGPDTGTGSGHHHRHGHGDDCGCMTPVTTTTPTPPPTTPTPTPTPTHHMPPPPPPPPPAPVPTPVGNTFPVTG